MRPLRIVHISPGYDLSESGRLPLPAVVREPREQELRRIFGDNIEITYLSEVGRSPHELTAAVGDATPDAVVLASAQRPYRQAVEAMSPNTLMLYPVTERYRDHHGYPAERLVGFGVTRKQGPQLAADGALADRSAIAEELAIQRAQQLERGEREQ